MRKRGLLGMCALLLGMCLWNNPLEVEAENYYYLETDTVSGGDSVSQGRWFKGGTEESNMIEGMPEELLLEDMYFIEAVPDDVCAEWLRELNGQAGDFNIFVEADTQIQIGSPEKELYCYNITNNGGTVSYYGDLYSVWAGVGETKDGVNCGGTTIINGDVDVVVAGVRDPYDSFINMNGTVQVNGNVKELDWIKTTKSENFENLFYKGFTGNVYITGTLEGGKIQEVVYDASIQKDTWHITGKIGNCAAGEFSMTDGVLSDKVVVTPVEPELGNYYFSYHHYHGDGVNGVWSKYAFNKDTNEFAFSEDCNQEDIPDGAQVEIFGTPKAVTLNRNVSKLNICNSDNGYPIDFTLNGNADEVYINIYPMSSCNAKISGNVDNMLVMYRYNPECNLTLGGKVEDAEAVINYGQNYFSAENMPIIINGGWNPELFMYTSKESNGIGYIPTQNEAVSDALEGSNIGEEVKVSTAEGEKTLVKAAEVLIEQAHESIMEQLGQKEELKASLENLKELLKTEAEKVKEALPVCAVDININTYFADKETGNKYESSGYATEAVRQLEQGKNLEFTVKVPADYFDAKAKYSIIREHWNEDGTSVMDILETVQKGDLLTFTSDRFSTFVIVKAEMEDASAAPPTTPAPAPIVTPVPTKTPVSAPVKTESPKVTFEPVTYIVQNGDTLSKIAYKHGLSLREILALNPQIKNPNLIYCKQVIVVGVEQSDGEETTQNVLAAERYYTVEKGDTLYKIARAHKMTLSDLASLNRVLTRQRYIYAGQRVRIK